MSAVPPHRPARVRSALREFLAREAAGGVVLMAATVLAMVIANSPLASAYHRLLDWPSGVTLAARIGPMTPHLAINDGLMALFFLLVGLEIKRELVDGRLATWGQRRLPVLAALGGMVVPAVIYLACVAGGAPALAHGWAIPAATDIAFAVGVLALLGSRAPASLKLLLVSVAIVDDLGAVVIIALFYSGQLDWLALTAAALLFAAMMAMNRLGIRALWPYLAGFALLWCAVLASGVHATIAGVLAALTIPVVRTPGRPDAALSPLHRLEHALALPVAFVIVPLFGLANAGVALGGIDARPSPVPLAVAAGLFAGKQLGVFGAIRLAVALRIAPRPGGANWVQVYALALLCGIGFTMSLFIGALAFADPALVEQAKLGTLAGSITAALAGAGLLRFARRGGGPVDDAADIAELADDPTQPAKAVR